MMTKTPEKLGPERMAEFEARATFLRSTNKDVDARNAKKLKECGTAIFKMSARNSTKAGKGWSADRFRGLENVSFLSLECKVLISTNLWKETGLVNGQPGVVKDVVYLEGQIPNKDLPAFIVVECPGYKGPRFFTGPGSEGKEKWVPIVPSSFSDDTFSATRTGYALRLAYAMTIHKSQGETLEMVDAGIGNNFCSLIVPGEKEIAPGMTFVCMSRCKSHHNLCIRPFAYDRISGIGDNPTIAARRIEQARQTEAAGITENAWRQENPEEILAWRAEFEEKRRLKEITDRQSAEAM
jgi:hypothetical protein